MKMELSENLANRLDLVQLHIFSIYNKNIVVNCKSILVKVNNSYMKLEIGNILPIIERPKLEPIRKTLVLFLMIQSYSVFAEFKPKNSSSKLINLHYKMNLNFKVNLQNGNPFHRNTISFISIKAG